MAVKVRIPTPLRTLTKGVDIVELGGSNVGELLNDLCGKFEGMDKRLFKQPGELNRFVNIYVNDEDIRYLQKDRTPLKAGDTVSIIPSVAGGTGTIAETHHPATAAQVASRPRDLPPLSADEVKRYSRHLILPEVGMDGHTGSRTSGQSREISRDASTISITMR